MPHPIKVKVYKWDQVKPLIYNWREARDGFQIFFLKLLVPSKEKHNSEKLLVLPKASIYLKEIIYNLNTYVASDTTFKYIQVCKKVRLKTAKKCPTYFADSNIATSLHLCIWKWSWRGPRSWRVETCCTSSLFNQITSTVYLNMLYKFYV